jgi:hypothetical protein
VEQGVVADRQLAQDLPGLVHGTPSKAQWRPRTIIRAG